MLHHTTKPKIEVLGRGKPEKRGRQSSYRSKEIIKLFTKDSVTEKQKYEIKKKNMHYQRFHRN